MCSSTVFRRHDSTVNPLQLGRRAVCSVCVVAMEQQSFLRYEQRNFGLDMLLCQCMNTRCADVADVSGHLCCRHSKLSGSNDLDKWAQSGAQSVREAYKEHLMGPIIAVKDELFKTFRFVELQRMSHSMTCCGASDCTETTVCNNLMFTAGVSPPCEPVCQDPSPP